MSTETTIETAPEKGSLKYVLSAANVRDQFAKALPKHLSADRFVRVAITALTRTPDLQKCTQASFMKCLLDLSAMGLEPDGRRAHLIPFKNTRANTTECTLVVDYKGIAELAMRSGMVGSIHCDKVCENDEFEVDRGRIVKHRIDYRNERGEPYAYYALITFKDGAEKAEVMSMREIVKVRDGSQGYKSAVNFKKSHPWISDFDEMAKKTVFRRCSKWVPLSPEIRDALSADDDEEIRMRDVTPEQKRIGGEAVNPFARDDSGDARDDEADNPEERDETGSVKF